MSRESKLKHIYDYIDNACYKKALTEIDKYLKKTKDVEYVKSLKALCLVRLNRFDEGQSLLDELTQWVITDDATLQAMTMAFLSMEQFDKIALIYENALKFEPGNEKFLTHLFMSYVRMKDYPKQKTVALNLYKAVPKNPYYFSGVMSIYMQSLEMSDQNMANKIILPLAEKMCEKFYNENKFEAENEIELYLMILEKQKKYSEMIQVIDSPAGQSKLKDSLGFVSYRKVELLKLVERYDEAFKLLLTLIKDNIDRYNYYLEAFELIPQCDKNSDELLEDLWNVVIENCSPPEVDSSSENYYRGRKSRGPFIVKIVLAQSILNNPNEFAAFIKKHEEISLPNYVQGLFEEFFEIFGHKIVCFKDMHFMFQKLQLNRKFINELLLPLQMTVSKLELNSLDDIQRYICFLYLKFYISNTEENWKFLQDNKKQLFEKHLKVYEILKQTKLDKDIRNGAEKIPLDKVQLNEKEQCPFDAIIHLFTLYFSNGIDLHHDKKAEEFSLDLLSFLEMALRKNDMDFYSKLFLVRLYASLGAGSICFKLYQELEVKHVLLDSLGFQFMQPILTSGCFDLSRKIISQMSSLYKGEKNEQSEYVVTSYRYGSFSKIAELNAFFDKLQNSIQHHLFCAERFSVLSMTDCKDTQQFHNIMRENLKVRSKFNKNSTLENTIDNRDMSIYSTNLDHEAYVDEIKQKSMNIEFTYSQYRNIFMEAFLSTYYLFNEFCFKNKFFDQESTDNHVQYSDIDMNSLKQSLLNLEEKRQEAKKLCETSGQLKYFFQGPPPSRLFTYINSCHHDLLVPILSYLNDILKYFYHQSESVQFNINIEALRNNFKQELKNFAADKCFHSLRKFIDYSSLSLESINFLLLSVETLSSTLAILKPGKKFKKLPNNEEFNNYEREVSNIIQNCKNLADFVGELFTILRESYKDYDDDHFKWIGSKKLQTFADFPEIEESSKIVKTKLIESYKTSLKTQVTILDFKQKYLKQLSIYKI